MSEKKFREEFTKRVEKLSPEGKAKYEEYKKIKAEARQSTKTTHDKHAKVHEWFDAQSPEIRHQLETLKIGKRTTARLDSSSEESGSE